MGIATIDARMMYTTGAVRQVTHHQDIRSLPALAEKDGQTAPKDKGNIQRTSSRQPMAEDGGMIPTSRHSAVTHLLGSADLPNDSQALFRRVVLWLDGQE